MFFPTFPQKFGQLSEGTNQPDRRYFTGWIFTTNWSENHNVFGGTNLFCTFLSTLYLSLTFEKSNDYDYNYG